MSNKCARMCIHLSRYNYELSGSPRVSPQGGTVAAKKTTAKKPAKKAAAKKAPARKAAAKKVARKAPAKRK